MIAFHPRFSTSSPSADITRVPARDGTAEPIPYSSGCCRTEFLKQVQIPGGTGSLRGGDDPRRSCCGVELCVGLSCPCARAVLANQTVAAAPAAQPRGGACNRS